MGQPLLRQVAAGQVDDMGDVTTRADPGVVDELLEPVRVPVA